jgi:signal transduction histidine kinase/CheY-like chemotaxis protein
MKKLSTPQDRLTRAEILAKTGNWELYLNTNKIIASNGSKKIYGLEINDFEFDLDKIQDFVLPEYRELLNISLKNLIDYDIEYDVEFKIKVGDNIKTIHSNASYDKNNIVFGVLQDITIQKQNEEALEKSNAVKTVFLSNMSHELRTPMNAIIGFSDIILTTNKNKNINQFIKSINSNAKHLDELLNNILDYSKIESNTIDILYENFLISDLFEDLYDIFNELNSSKNLNFVKLQFINVNNDMKITSDYLRLKQVLFNILSNSIKFTDNGYIILSTFVDNDFLTFKIEDTGIGIESDKLSLVFDRFWQSDSSSRKKYKGTGLGLSICKSIVELLNGEISLESTINEGTTFYVKIPLDKIENKIQKNELYFPGKTVLVIDDIPATYSLLGIYLNSLNINMIFTHSGKEAIEIYKKQKEKIELIILDLNLFDMSSFELIRSFKAICGKCKIISKSGRDDQKNELVYAHLKKPINKNILISILNEIWQK